MRQSISCLMALIVCGAVPAAGQTADDQVAQGVAISEARRPAEALVHFEAALAADSMHYEANWRAAVALINLGKQIPDNVKSAERDSLYSRAERYGRRAVKAKLLGADGHYALAAAIGRASLTKSKKERVERAAEIRVEAKKALELEPTHDGALHVLGRWHAEIMRLSGIQRFFAKNFLGGKVFDEASWDKAVEYLQAAVAAAPEKIYHHLDLAEVYIDQKRYAEARAELQQVQALPPFDAMDPTYQRQAGDFLEQIAGKS